MTSPGWASRNRAALRLGIRISVAGLLTFIVSRALGIAQSYPAVLTAVVVMQSSVGASLKAMLDRFLGSFGGAAWGVAVLLIFRPSNALAYAVAITAALAPLAFLAAFKPGYRAAPMTAIILLLSIPNAANPFGPAIQRMLGIGLGSIVALVVALLLFPEKAREALADAAGRAVARMGDLVVVLTNASRDTENQNAIETLHSELRKALISAETAADEAKREQTTFLTGGPDLQPICRTLRRLRSDLVMIARTTAEPLPDTLQERLVASMSGVASAIAAFLHTSAAALHNRKSAPSLSDVDQVLARHYVAISEARRSGLTRNLSDEMVGRVFGFEFALEQMHLNLRDLIDRINELA